MTSSKTKRAKKHHSDEFKAEAIKTLFYEKHKRAGAAPIHGALGAQGMACDIKTVSASMRRQGLVAKGSCKFKVTTDSNHTVYLTQ